jgi:hypothetical protein
MTSRRVARLACAALAGLALAAAGLGRYHHSPAAAKAAAAAGFPAAYAAKLGKVCTEVFAAAG